MNYRDRAKNRRLRKDVLSVLNLLKFKTGNIKLSGKVVLFGIIISTIGLFSSWIINIESYDSENSFSVLVGNLGFTGFISIIFLVFLVLSINRKEKVKMYSGLEIKDHIIIILIGFFLTILGIHGVIFIKSLLIFSKDINLGNGSILFLTGNILIIIGGFLMKKDYNKENTFFINEAEGKIKNNLISEKSSNMKLPF